jgi:hypothetical protein
LIELARGLGERQKREKEATNRRICFALYHEPYTSEMLWKKTNIHKNALVLRLNELVNSGVVKKRYPRFVVYEGRFFKHNFYLLNLAESESKDIISHVFDEISTVDKSYLIPYRINSINCSDCIGKIDSIVMSQDYTRRDLEKKIIGLDIEEKSIMLELIRIFADRNQKCDNCRLIEKRDKILATLILACAQYYVKYLLLKQEQTWSYDFLISLLLKPLRLFDPPMRPYAKVFKIMQSLGF